MSRPPSKPPQNNFYFKLPTNFGMPMEADRLFRQGLALLQQGATQQAREVLEKAIKINPKHFDALNILGIIAAQTKDFDKAIGFFDQAVKINPNNAVCYCNRGNVLKELRQFEKAISNYKKAISLNKDYALAYVNQSIALFELHNYEESLDSCDRAIKIQPDYAEAFYNRGNILDELMRFDEALNCFDKAIELKPDYVEAYSNRGAVLQELKRFEEALQSHDVAITLDPNYADAYSNRGVVLKELKRFDEALASYDKAIGLKSIYAEAYWNKSLLLLHLGNFQIGWQLYEWRWKSEQKNQYRNFTQPLWLGDESIANKTILLHAEQGLGDTIQFCRYAASVKRLGARVLLEVPKSLSSLLKDTEGVDEVFEAGKQLPAFDYQCPLLSLPLAFKTELNSIPSPTTYLNSNDEKLDLWNQRLGEKSKPRIGLVWSGSTIHITGQNRSLALADLIKYLPINFEYVSLQKEVRDSDKDALANSAIKNHSEQLSDFTDTAALCDLMDIVISVDTSVAHLSAALGKPTWILLTHMADWRWLLDRFDSPWYESVKLYRQAEDRQWGPVLERVTRDLIELSK